MKIIHALFLTIAAMVFSGVSAQENNKFVLGIGDITYSNTERGPHYEYFTDADIEPIKEQLVDVIRNNGCLAVLDDDNDAPHSLKANCLLLVNLDELLVQDKTYVESSTSYIRANDRDSSTGGGYSYTVKNASGNVTKAYVYYYTAFIKYTVKIIDCESGTILAQKSLKYDCGTFFGHRAEYWSSHSAHWGIMERCIKRKAVNKLINNASKARARLLRSKE